MKYNLTERYDHDEAGTIKACVTCHSFCPLEEMLCRMGICYETMVWRNYKEKGCSRWKRREGKARILSNREDVRELMARRNAETASI